LEGHLQSVVEILVAHVGGNLCREVSVEGQGQGGVVAYHSGHPQVEMDLLNLGEETLARVASVIQNREPSLAFQVENPYPSAAFLQMDLAEACLADSSRLNE